MAVYTNPNIDQEPSPKQVFYPDNKVGIFTCNGSPEGVILANTGSIALSDNGSVYKKTTDDLNTGWIELQSGTITSPAVISGTNPTLSLVDTTVGDDDGSISMDADVMTITVVGGTPLVLRSNGQILSIPRCIESNFTAVGNVGAGLDTLHTFTLPINSLAANGDYLSVVYSGAFSTNDNDKRIQVSFGGQVVVNTGPFDMDTGQWYYTVTYQRRNSTTVIASVLFTWGFLSRDGAGATVGNFIGQGSNVILTVADLAANTMLMVVEAVGIADNDIVQNTSTIELVQR